MTPTLDEVKNEGIRKHLFDVVSNCLWTAKCAVESARETRDARYVKFEDELKKAKEAIKEAERFYTELQNYI